MSEIEIVRRIFFSVVCAVMIAFFVSVWLGERKYLWFKKRENWNIFTKRGWAGEKLNYGRPVCKEGYIVTAGLFAAIGLVTAIIFLV